MSDEHASGSRSEAVSTVRGGDQIYRPQSMQAVYRRRSAFSFPRAAQPEVVRAYQKDIYYRDILQTQLQDVVRSLFGSRVLFANVDSISFTGSLAYFILSTLGGAQTLGEEYVNAMMTDGISGRVVGLKRRFAFIACYVIAPFLSVRAYSALRRRLAASHDQRTQSLQRARTRAAAVSPRRNHAGTTSKDPQPSLADRIVGILAERLPSVDSIQSSSSVLTYLSAAHLALFYLGGRYYKFSQRASGTEYISTIARRPGSKPPSYEVLGFLLGVQLVIKTALQVNRWRTSWVQERDEEHRTDMGDSAASQNAASAAPKAETVEIDQLQWSHRSSPPVRVQLGSSMTASRSETVPLMYPDPDGLPSAEELELPKDVDRKQLQAARAASKVKAAELESIGQSVLRCTLCMEQREPEKGTSAVTECGHVFCWDCILGWSKEKPECPLCRQSLNPSHLLPIYNF